MHVYVHVCVRIHDMMRALQECMHTKAHWNHALHVHACMHACVVVVVVVVRKCKLRSCAYEERASINCAFKLATTSASSPIFCRRKTFIRST